MEWTHIIRAGPFPPPHASPSNQERDHQWQPLLVNVFATSKLTDRGEPGHENQHILRTARTLHYEPTTRCVLLAFGRLYLWKMYPFPTVTAPSCSPASSQGRDGSQSTSITARQGDDIMVNWRGYLSGDGEFFTGLTEINRSLPGSILLCKELKDLKATCPIPRPAFVPFLVFPGNPLWSFVFITTTLLFYLLCSSFLSRRS